MRTGCDTARSGGTKVSIEYIFFDLAQSSRVGFHVFAHLSRFWKGPEQGKVRGRYLSLLCQMGDCVGVDPWWSLHRLHFVLCTGPIWSWIRELNNLHRSKSSKCQFSWKSSQDESESIDIGSQDWLCQHRVEGFACNCNDSHFLRRRCCSLPPSDLWRTSHLRRRAPLRLISCFSAGREDFSSARSAGLAASGWRERSHGGHLGREACRTSLQGAIDNVSHVFPLEQGGQISFLCSSWAAFWAGAWRITCAQCRGWDVRHLNYSEWFGLWPPIVDARPWDRMAWFCKRCHNICCPPSCRKCNCLGVCPVPDAGRTQPTLHWRSFRWGFLQTLPTLNVAPDCQARRVSWPEWFRAVHGCWRCLILFDFVSCCLVILSCAMWGPFWDICLASRLSDWWSSHPDCKQFFQGATVAEVDMPSWMQQSSSFTMWGWCRVFMHKIPLFLNRLVFKSLTWEDSLSFVGPWICCVQGEIGTAFYIIASGQAAWKQKD